MLIENTFLSVEDNEFNIFRNVHTRKNTHINWYSKIYQMFFRKLRIDN